MKRNLIAAFMLLSSLVLASVSTLRAQQTFGTTIYLDYRYLLSQAGPTTLKPADPTKAYINNQFIFRRAYFTYENKINDNLKFRFRLDADNTANVTGVSLTGSPVSGVGLSKDDKLRPFIKHLYLEWSNFLMENLTLRVGMEETLTFNLEEAAWGYRSVAKTLLDGYKDITGVDINATSADIGASLQGSATKYVRYGAQVVNGSGYSHLENDQYKKVSGQLQLIPIQGFSIVGYVDYARQLPKTALPLETKPGATTYKIDSTLQMVKGLVLGGTWFTYRNDLNQTVDFQRFGVSGWSVFGRFALNQKNLNAFARYDWYTPNTKDSSKDLGLWIFGLDWAPLTSNMKLQPNLWIYSYKNGPAYNANATSNTDVAFNLTFFLSF